MEVRGRGRRGGRRARAPRRRRRAIEQRARAAVAAAAALLAATAAGAETGAGIEDPDGRAMRRIGKALGRVASKEPGAVARIAQVGDSHTASDLLTGALRRRLQARLGDGGHGFVVPGRPWSLYRHLDVRHGSRPRLRVTRLRPAGRRQRALGLGGVLLGARSRGARAFVGTVPGAAVGGAASRLDVYFQRHPGGGRARLLLDGAEAGTLETKAATTEPAYRLLRAPDGPHDLAIEAFGDGEVRLFGVVLEREGPGVVVDSLGVPGLRAESLLQSEAATLHDNLRRRRPDLIVLAFGTVEANHPGFDPSGYSAVMRRVIAHLRGGAPTASCLVLGPPDRCWRVGRGDSWATRPVLARIVEAQREAAAAAGCGFFDARAAMGGPGSIDRWARASPRLAQRDRVHLTARGYDRIAASLEAALLSAPSTGGAPTGASRASRSARAAALSPLPPAQ